MEIPETRRFIPKGFELGTTLKVKCTKKLKYFVLSLYLHQTLKRTILSEIWVKIFLPKPLEKDKRSKSEHFRRLHENVSEIAA